MRRTKGWVRKAASNLLQSIHIKSKYGTIVSLTKCQKPPSRFGQHLGCKVNVGHMRLQEPVVLRNLYLWVEPLLNPFPEVVYRKWIGD